ncbi:hypothetical protein F5148DRAFT_1164359, partial [Russula earlei]
ILGLAHAYLKHLHPSKLAQPDESMKASAHLLKLFLNDTLHHPQSTAPSRELNSLQNRLTSLETTLINLTQASVDMRKEIKALPKNTTTPAKAKVPVTPASNTTPTYAAKASLPPCPCAVMKTSAYTWPASLRPNPADICATINSALCSTNNNQVHVSTTRWTQKAHNLMTSLPTISEALQASLSVNSISAFQEPPTSTTKRQMVPINLCPRPRWHKGPGTPPLMHPTHAWACGNPKALEKQPTKEHQQETPHPKTSNPQPNWCHSHPKRRQLPAQPHSPCPNILHQTGLHALQQNTTCPHALDTC